MSVACNEQHKQHANSLVPFLTLKLALPVFEVFHSDEAVQFELLVFWFIKVPATV